ncbi:MAG: hypothetical protein UIH27_09015 [Ruminococcus sp.]|nr:hypothetical protein [Ruminococcus sp.]
MRDIIVYTDIHEGSQVNVGVAFKNVTDCRLVSVNLKVVCDNGETYQLINNKMLFVSNSFSVWADSILQHFSSTPIKSIVEIHSSGKLLFIQSFPLIKKEQNEMSYYLNSDVCWRNEDFDVISIFNTNGNLLFLKGIYKDLWEALLKPINLTDLLVLLLKKGYTESKIKASINSLINRGLILEVNESSIEYI